MTSERVYLDHAATSPLRPEVAAAMAEAAQAADFNPSSMHAEGRRARALLDGARDRIAAVLGASRKEIAFTAGGTEADNAAIAGVARASSGPRRIVTSAVEHHAVLHSVESLAREGYAVEAVGVDDGGAIDAPAFSAALDRGAAIASIVYANNEIGTVAPIAALARAARDRGIAFHTDAVQAAPWLSLDVRELGVDLLSISAHKLGGPKGAGLLFVRDGTPFEPLMHGGGQEFGRRSGTENLAGIAGLAAALELAAADREEAGARVAGLRDRLEAGILAAVPEVRVNGRGPRLPNILNLSFAGLRSDELLVRLDLEGIAVSAGSACTSGVLEPSHVIAALHAGPEWGTGPIRFSLGRATAAAEIDRVLGLLPGMVAQLRGNRVARP